ncbi:MAG: PDZ domain-containing protein [Algisphaera sp.]
MRNLLTLLILSLIPCVAKADDNTPQKIPLAERLTALDDPDYALRETATDLLLHDDTLDLDALAQAMPAAPSPELRQRLLNIAHHHTVRKIRFDSFETEGRGSIGVVQSMVSEPDDVFGPEKSYVLVTRALPGFPAYGRLRPMDQIVGLNDQPLNDLDQVESFPRMLQAFNAGQEIHLTVLRNGETLDVSLTLASRTALAAIYTQPGFTLSPKFDDLWQQRRKAFDWPSDEETQ